MRLRARKSSPREPVLSLSSFIPGTYELVYLNGFKTSKGFWDPPNGRNFVQCTWSSTLCETRSSFRLEYTWNRGQGQWLAWLIRGLEGERAVSETNSGIQRCECTYRSGNQVWRPMYHTLIPTGSIHQRRGTKQLSRQNDLSICS